MASRHNSEDELRIQKISHQVSALLEGRHFFRGHLRGRPSRKGGTTAWVRQDITENMYMNNWLLTVTELLFSLILFIV